MNVPLAGKVFEDNIVVKTAHGRLATKKLSEEFSLYCSLSSNSQKCKISTVYGFYVDLSNEDDPSAVLLLRDVGMQLYRSTVELSHDQLYVQRPLRMILDDAHAFP